MIFLNENADMFPQVIVVARETGNNDDLIKFLQMARVTQREPLIETELAFAYARSNRLHDLEELIANPASLAKVQEVRFTSTTLFLFV